jgi:hypothetical protein
MVYFHFYVFETGPSDTYGEDNIMLYNIILCSEHDHA